MKSRDSVFGGLDIRPDTLLTLPEGLSLEIISVDGDTIRAKFSGEEEELILSRDQLEAWVLNEKRIPPELFLLIREIEALNRKGTGQPQAQNRRKPLANSGRSTAVSSAQGPKGKFSALLIPLTIITIGITILTLQVIGMKTGTGQSPQGRKSLSQLPDDSALPAGFSGPSGDSDQARDFFTILERANPGATLEKSGSTVIFGALTFQFNNGTIAVTHAKLGPLSHSRLGLGQKGFLIPSETMSMEILARSCSQLATETTGPEPAGEKNESASTVTVSQPQKSEKKEYSGILTKIPAMGNPEFLAAEKITPDFVMENELGIQPGEAVGLNIRAQKALEKNDPATALPLLRKLLGHDPGNVMTRYRIGQIYLAQNHLEGASRIFSLLLEKEPENALFLAGSAEICRLNGDAQGFIKGYEKVISLEAWNTSAKLKMAAGLSDFGMADRVKVLLDQVLAKEPESREQAQRILARAYTRAGDFQKAVPLVLEMADANPGNQELLDNLMVTLIGAENFEEALRQSEKRLSSGLAARAAGWYGHILYRYLARPSAALNWLRTALQSNMTAPAFLQDYGLASLETGLLNDSLWAFETLLRNGSSPVNPEEKGDSSENDSDHGWKENTAARINAIREAMDYEIR